jgi:hypothetical protein
VLGEEVGSDVLAEPVSEIIPVEVPIQEVVPTDTIAVQEDVPSMYSSFASTSRDGIPATVTGNNGGEGTGAFPPQSTFEKSAVQPSMILQAVYALLALLVIVALILSIVIEWRKQHPAQIAYAGGLLAVMALLLHAHTLLTSGVAIM